ncbi:hypothetical protein EV182_004926 [Spiromyces aspiralis]|uniref:Uncharacterized protein n=1 Tax=Spiromyces aspiralis TaxID=68401 RepID=A0ACC1HAM4_9FUNG|nr:hypothetical protein EV182_004926 [Spiromyces aspiralis]
MVGLSLSYVLQLIGHAQWAVRQSVEVELCFISVERNIAYTQLPREEEPDEVADALELEGPWPEEGRIEIRDLSLHYFGSDRPALSKITLSLGKCEKIGVVGRTGAGKSSLLSCLFRLAGHLEGSLEIDGIEITRLRLADLRANLSIIPQEPFLFEGTLRFNVDPFNEHTDDEVWAALEAAELKRLVSALPDKLETRIVENGRNFSVVMDEPTANIDVQTDRIIQRSIHSQFRNMTVLTIAHRLHTVLCEGYDKILVLDQGQVKEFDEPWVLLQNSDGWLSRMVAETGPETAMMLRSTAKELYLKKHSHQQ